MSSDMKKASDARSSLNSILLNTGKSVYSEVKFRLELLDKIYEIIPPNSTFDDVNKKIVRYNLLHNLLYVRE